MTFLSLELDWVSMLILGQDIQDYQKFEKFQLRLLLKDLVHRNIIVIECRTLQCQHTLDTLISVFLDHS